MRKLKGKSASEAAKVAVVWTFVVTFGPQKHEVVVLLEVQLRGEDGWLQVKIRCPLTRTDGNRTQLVSAGERGRLVHLG